MKTLIDYIEDAKRNASIESDRALCRALGCSYGLIGYYRHKSVLPTDDLMVTLAQLGGHDPYIALMHLNEWRAPEAARKWYKDLAERVKVASIITAIIFLTIAPSSASAAEDIRHNIENNIYYGNCKRFINLMRNMLKQWNIITQSLKLQTPSYIMHA